MEKVCAHSLGLHDDGELRFCAHREYMCVEHNSGQANPGEPRVGPRVAWAHISAAAAAAADFAANGRAAGLLFACSKPRP